MSDTNGSSLNATLEQDSFQYAVCYWNTVDKIPETKVQGMCKKYLTSREETKGSRDAVNPSVPLYSACFTGFELFRLTSLKAHPRFQNEYSPSASDLLLASSTA